MIVRFGKQTKLDQRYNRMALTRATIEVSMRQLRRAMKTKAI
jgi:hypothetical protein